MGLKLEKYDNQHRLVRFTPWKPRSKWSALNRDRALTLIKEGRMRPAGFAQIEAAKADGRWAGAYAPAIRAEIPVDLQKALDTNPKASAFFATLNRQNRYAILYRIGNVKKAETRARKPRVGKTLIVACRSRRANPHDAFAAPGCGTSRLINISAGTSAAGTGAAMTRTRRNPRD